MVIDKEKRIDVQEREIQRKQRELSATVEKPAEAEKFRIQTLSDAEKYNLRITAEGAADAVKLKGFAEADVIQRTGEAEAEANKAIGLAQAEVIKAQGFAEAQAMEKKAAAWRKYNEAAITQMFIEKLPDIARAVSEPLAKTERIVVVSTGGDSGAGAGASKITKDVTNIIAQLPPIIESLTGVSIEEMVKRIPQLKGGYDEGESPPGDDTGS